MIELPDYEFLLRQYREPFRAYHGLSHIKDLLSLFDKREEISDLNTEESYELVEAIWRHDVFYHIPAKDKSNEELSALHHEHVSPRSLRAAAAIRATEHHFDGSLYEDPIINLMLDLDIFSFSKPYMEFYQTNLNIDAEFEAFNPAQVVAEKRRAFLQSILDQNSLRYRILDDRTRLETIAYDNIHKYLKDRYG